MEDVREWLDLLALRGVKFAIDESGRITWMAPPGVVNSATLATLKDHRHAVAQVLRARERRELDVSSWPADFQAAYRELVQDAADVRGWTSIETGEWAHRTLAAGVRYFALLDAGATREAAAQEAFGAPSRIGSTPGPPHRG